MGALCPSFFLILSIKNPVRLFLFILPILVLTSCKYQNPEHQTTSADFPFYLGTYTGPESEGIYKYSLSQKGKLKKISLAAKCESPSFLCLSPDKNYVIAVSETSDEKGMGSVGSFRISGDSLTFTSSSSSGGAHPCYVSSCENSYVIIANYTGGNLGLLSINNKGELSELQDIQQHSGKGTTDRQMEPHAHSAMFDPQTKNIIAADLGTNEIWFSKIDDKRNKLLPLYPHRIKLESGAGPRHMAFHPNGNFLYVINELNNTVSLLKRNQDKIFTLGSSVSSLPPDFEGESYCADIHISSDGKFLYASNRGHNSIAIFKIVPENGKLIPKGHQDIHGDWPRNFSLSPDEKFLLVANQKSGNIVSFQRDEKTGLLEFLHMIDAPNPVCILFQD